MLARAALLLEETKASKQFMIEYFTLTFKCHKKALSLQSEGMYLCGFLYTVFSKDYAVYNFNPFA